MATSRFVEAMRAEIASLEAELARDVRFIRLRELRKLTPLYGDDNHAETPKPAAATAMPSIARTRQSPRQSSSERESALASSREYIISRGDVVPTRDILVHLAKLEIEVGGSNPLNNLSAILSTSGLFRAHGRQGWTLRDGTEPVLGRADYESIASEFVSDLSSDEIEHVSKHIAAGNGVPNEIDGRMLAISRNRNDGRDLTGAQTKALRAMFIDEIRKLSSPSN